LFARFPLARLVVALAVALIILVPAAARADGDEVVPGVVDVTSLGLQPLTGPIAAATPAPGESRLRPGPDGVFRAIPEVRGRTKTFHIVGREAPWTLKPGLTVMAKTYNGVVPGPALVVDQGDRVVIDYTNDLPVGDTIHLHGIHGGTVAMDGVAGISQPQVAPHGGRFRYVFLASQPGTFIYHTHGPEAMLDSGLYGAIVVRPSHPRPEERVAHDYLGILSSWKIQSSAENHQTLNGRSYPATVPFEVASGERIRIRWINISGEEMHTMHVHGHNMRLIARDALPLTYVDRQDTVFLGPGQRVDVILVADAKPGTWLLHCHVIDHTEDAAGHPDGLVTAVHYRGTPQILGAMGRAMASMDIQNLTGAPRRALSFVSTVVLGAIAGLTVFLGLPIARARRLPVATIGALNAVAIGILVFLVVEIAHDATSPVEQAVALWHGGGPVPFALGGALVAGLLVGLVGLGSISTQFARRGSAVAEHPMTLAMMIAAGIGAHNFAEGLAIGASAALGQTALALGLIVGFALHNATEGFGVAAPLSGRDTIPSWRQLSLAGLVAGGPTFLGTVIGYTFVSPLLSTFFLAIAAGALVFVIGELWSMLKRLGGTSVLATAMVALGFCIALGSEILIGLNTRPVVAAHTMSYVTISPSRPASRAKTTSIAMRSPTETSRPQRYAL
jgi:ZIP family zinc transporter